MYRVVDAPYRMVYFSEQVCDVRKKRSDLCSDKFEHPLVSVLVYFLSACKTLNVITKCNVVLSFLSKLGRYLMYLGYEVNYVRNFTDVDDKVS